MLKAKYCTLLFTILFTYTTIYSDQRPQQDKLWDQFKQRVNVLKELKSKIAPKPTLEPMPANFNPQSLIHLQTLFGAEKKEDELIKLAMNYSMPGFPLPLSYRLQTEFTENDLQSLAKTIIDAEKKYWNYFVLYHGQQGALILIHDIMRSLYAWLALETPNEQTKFLRLFTANTQELKNVDAFLEPLKSKMLDRRGTFDHLPEVKNFILATNFALFANAGEFGESTWYFFAMGKSIKAPILKEELIVFFKFFDFNEKFIHEIIDIHQKYIKAVTPEIGLSPEEAAALRTSKMELHPGILCQIFIHPTVIDELTYLSEFGGYLFDFTVTPSLLRQAAIFSKKDTQDSNWVKQLKEQNEYLRKATFDASLNRISVQKYLNIFRSRPNEINPFIMNYAQGRLYLKYSTLMNPEKVKIITYKSPSIQPKAVQAAEQEYKQKLTIIVEKIIKDWLFREQKTGSERTKLEKLFDFLSARIKAEEANS